MIAAGSIFQWLRDVWRGHEKEVMRQYGLLPVSCPLVLADIRKLAYADRTTVVPGDPVMTAYNEGMRSVWLHIQENIGINPAELDAILKEIGNE